MGEGGDGEKTECDEECVFHKVNMCDVINGDERKLVYRGHPISNFIVDILGTIY